MAGDSDVKRDGGFLKIALLGEYRGKTFADALRQMGLDVDLPCGGNGRCGKCLAYVETETEGSVTGGYFKLCRTVFPEKGSVSVIIPESMLLRGTEQEMSPDAFSHVSGKTDISGKKQAFLAVDTGTTTVEAALVNRGETLLKFATLNPQKKYGADVISRIAFSETEGGLAKLSSDIRGCINGMLSKCRSCFPDIGISEIFAAGNTTMQHLLLGISPAGIGRYPFTPAFTETKKVRGRDVGVDADFVTLLPSADGFIGADVVAGAALCLDGTGSSNELFIDLGTNGEMILKADGKYFATSSAAGPCFEGANISCGTGGIEGAVDSVKETPEGILIRTVGGKPPAGICGSGLLSLTALLLKKGIIDETGLMDEDYEIKGFTETESGRRFVDTGLVLTKKDVREFQLAKAAIRTGVELLLRRGGVKPEDISSVYVAGGLGTHIDPGDALKTGLFPGSFEGKFKTPGNTSLKGAAAAGNDKSFIGKASALALKIESFPLNDEKDFNEKFVDNMLFE